MDKNPDVELALRYSGYYERRRERSEQILRDAVARAAQLRANDEAWQASLDRRERRFLLRLAALVCIAVGVAVARFIL